MYKPISLTHYLCFSLTISASSSFRLHFVFSCMWAVRMTVTEKISQRDPDEEILKAFRLFDDDSSGKITLKNLRRVARELGETMTDDELQAMIDEFDRDGDGEINEEDFMAIMRQNDDF
eukprot:TRINITY_DN1905_c0_g1_i1.p1 TRINITY_DN1905_c0_g1~~TRINITY_DN1905_c0_g1_i1.p1  ORF type:complete len:119 (-),score=36.23 TRINITY_DN1905_c0_g1_i1:261-617(-)